MKKKATQKRRVRRRIEVPKKCYFCTERKEPHFSNTEVLWRFLTERGKIIGRSRNGLCAKHHRDLTITIKHARHLALLPFIVR
ncbi:MAG: 30S ribosomal protein S18 [Candidatus Levybacteria bacterium RIFCSPHIGHO2_12_FULL_38_12]|nr:MAG: 30S ribosomal protein S18 [Candidatus Levybacteria bacterium RIFCSPHIGHO2_01_FULL_38_12]OGH22114.1 MAG: 30S ribosomal protein S18 [Candidatus Levybacteria bacterium RIFCSPHIGHO2_02_FULL_37_18]OGH22962.1 MAG: 30S ribosomal protein S18 [Candidatus Levybacteria bacterium RIFCSPHIGHO2_12_FULL_38_12]OGH34132.1 MAG: 30S ribosomal protein S18 [Candidatus Levybacteria bacterium RIFCSPLOWO2_01_FULL_37_20]OGH44925.1 MAG: 30S ribosomal protein S18 [Candidatus Levybacteria bacterium RIFCSPLOWO2_02_